MKTLIKILSNKIVSLLWLILVIFVAIVNFTDGATGTAWFLIMVAAFTFRSMYWEWMWKQENAELKEEIKQFVTIHKPFVAKSGDVDIRPVYMVDINKIPKGMSATNLPESWLKENAEIVYTNINKEYMR